MYRDVDRGTFEKDRELIEWAAQTRLISQMRSGPNRGATNHTRPQE